MATLGGSNLGARMIQRIVLNRQGLPQRQGIQPVLGELKQRMRDVKQGPDGLIYVAVDETDGAILRIEPVENPKP